MQAKREQCTHNQCKLNISTVCRLMSSIAKALRNDYLNVFFIFVLVFPLCEEVNCVRVCVRVCVCVSIYFFPFYLVCSVFVCVPILWMLLKDLFWMNWNNLMARKANKNQPPFTSDCDCIFTNSKLLENGKTNQIHKACFVFSQICCVSCYIFFVFTQKIRLHIWINKL